VRCGVDVDVEIYIYRWCGVGRRIFSDFSWSGGEFLAGDDGWKCPNCFCLLGYPVRSGIVSIGVFCALYSFLFPNAWVIIGNYTCIYIFSGRDKVVNYCFCFYVLRFIECRFSSVLVVTVLVPFRCKCGYFSRSAIFPVWLFFFEAFS